MAEHDDDQPIDEALPPGKPEPTTTEGGKPPEAPPSPLDLEAMEVSIRQRLGKVIQRAKGVQTAVKQLQSRAEPITRARAAALGLVDEKKSRLRPLVEAVRKRSEATGRAIREVTSDLDYQLSLRDEMLHGALAALGRLEAVVEAPLEDWVGAVHQRHVDLLSRADAVGQWLEAAELRWAPAASGASTGVPANDRQTGKAAGRIGNPSYHGAAR